MKPKIFYRQRTKVGEKEKKPRFRMVAVAGIELNFYTDHLRKKELEQIAKEVGATMIELKIEPEDAEVKID